MLLIESKIFVISKIPEPNKMCVFLKEGILINIVQYFIRIILY